MNGCAIASKEEKEVSWVSFSGKDGAARKKAATTKVLQENEIVNKKNLKKKKRHIDPNEEVRRHERKQKLEQSYTVDH